MVKQTLWSPRHETNVPHFSQIDKLQVEKGGLSLHYILKDLCKMQAKLSKRMDFSSTHYLRIFFDLKLN